MWYRIYRKKEVGSLVMLQFFYSDWTWWTNKTLARILYTEEDAAWELVSIKFKDEWEKSD